MARWTHSSTGELVQQVARGEVDSLDELFTRHRTRLARIVSLRLDGRLRTRVDVEDVLQEIYLEAARRLEAYLRNAPMPFFEWLCCLARQKLVDIHRRHLAAGIRDVRREVRPHRSSTGHTVFFEGDGAGRAGRRPETPTERAFKNERRLIVGHALERLPSSERQVLVLRHFEGLTYLEIAARLAISREAAVKRYIRALRKLKRALEREIRSLD